MKNTVDEQLSVGVSDTNIVQDRVKVVRDQTVTRPLGEESNRNNDPHALPVSSICEEGFPSDARNNIALELNGSLNFLEFVLNQRIVGIAIGVVVSESLECLFFTATAHEPTGRFGCEPDESNLDDRRKTL